jgi:hypothetical protein
VTRNVVAWAALAGSLFVFALAAGALGAEPEPTAIDQFFGGDPRSEGAGPGIVGSPLLILGGVVLLGFAIAVITVAIARLSQHR